MSTRERKKIMKWVVFSLQVLVSLEIFCSAAWRVPVKLWDHSEKACIWGEGIVCLPSFPAAASLSPSLSAPADSALIQAGSSL